VIFGTVIFWHITWTRPHYYIITMQMA